MRSATTLAWFAVRARLGRSTPARFLSFRSVGGGRIHQIEFGCNALRRSDRQHVSVVHSDRVTLSAGSHPASRTGGLAPGIRSCRACGSSTLRRLACYVHLAGHGSRYGKRGLRHLSLRSGINESARMPGGSRAPSRELLRPARPLPQAKPLRLVFGSHLTSVTCWNARCILSECFVCDDCAQDQEEATGPIN